MAIERLEFEYEYKIGKSLIGKKVRKRSNNPFKSKEKVNTCIGVVRNEYSSRWALIFAEDDSCVDVYQCKEADEYNDH